MTVTTTYAPATFTGDGSTATPFALPHLVYQSSHVSITLDGATTTAWSATGYGDAGGISVTFDTAPALAVAIVIQRIVPYTQDTDLENFDGNPADVTEKQFDLLAMADQQISEQIDRTILTPIGTSLTTNEITGTINTTVKVLTLTTAGPAAVELASLSTTLDTTFTGLASGDYFRYDGASWVNDTAAETVTALGVQAQDNILDDLAGLTQATAKIPYFDSATTAAVLDFKDEDDLVSDSATALASQQSVKAYVDALDTGWTFETAVATTSGASVTASSTIPTTANEVILQMTDVSCTLANTTISLTMIDAGGEETTGYISTYQVLNAAQETLTTGIQINDSGFDQTDSLNGSLTLIIKDEATFLWEINGITRRAGGVNNMGMASATKATSQALSGLIIKVSTGAFDAGSVRIGYRT